MKGKKDSLLKSSSGKKEPMVKESSSGRYARQKPRKPSLRVGTSLADVKRKLSRPIKRSDKDIEWALGIAGIGEGPEDLAENMRAYLRDGR